MPLPLIAIPAAVTSIGAYFAGKEVLSWVATGLKGTFALLAIGSYVAFIVLFINGFTDLYYLIMDFINYIQNPSSTGTGSGAVGSFMLQFFGLLECIGFLSGINAVKGIILSAISWRLISNITVRFTIFTYMTYGALSKTLSK